jgi:hypothetical protein
MLEDGGIVEALRPRGAERAREAAPAQQVSAGELVWRHHSAGADRRATGPDARLPGGDPGACTASLIDTRRGVESSRP